MILRKTPLLVWNASPAFAGDFAPLLGIHRSKAFF
jgi:hypothetical protein